MPFDSEYARVISDNFRSACVSRLTNDNRLLFERWLQAILGIKNLRNVQLWTRNGTVRRNFIYSRLGELELDLRVLIATKWINEGTATFPTTNAVFNLSNLDESARRSFLYLTDPYVSRYLWSIKMSGSFLIFEYATDSDAEIEEVDLESPEFDDVDEFEFVE